MADNIFAKSWYVVAGLGVGSIVSILFAPKSGEDTRKYLVNRAKKASGHAQKQARALRGCAEDLIEHSKGVISQKKDQIVTAVKVGREVYQQEQFVGRTRRRNARESTVGF